ncbi:hypothetical protein CBUD_0054 [Coxiella burnetii Dugway 5J108-111]|nr:hypothetical protein CBUD_0054 [Coxiella burnetii Dugway 5J108-111]
MYANHLIPALLQTQTTEISWWAKKMLVSNTSKSYIKGAIEFLREQDKSITIGAKADTILNHLRHQVGNNKNSFAYYVVNYDRDKNFVKETGKTATSRLLFELPTRVQEVIGIVTNFFSPRRKRRDEPKTDNHNLEMTKK